MLPAIYTFTFGHKYTRAAVGQTRFSQTSVVTELEQNGDVQILGHVR